MPRVHTITARTDRYHRGAHIPDPKVKKGYRVDKSKPHDENDTLFCKKGDVYFKWTMYRSSPSYSLIRPSRSMLTTSEYLAQCYGIEDRMGLFGADTVEEIREFVDELKDEIETLRDEQEEKRENMPESLQYSPTGELLQERYDGLNEFYNELDCLELEDFNASELDEGEDEDQAREEHVEEQIQNLRDITLEIN